MKNLFVFLSALTFMTQAYSLDPNEFTIENNSNQTISIQVQPAGDRFEPCDSVKLTPGQRKAFKKEDLGLRGIRSDAKAKLFIQGATQGSSFDIKYPPENNVRLTDSLLFTYGVK